jgi:hypothetical protein
MRIDEIPREIRNLRDELKQLKGAANYENKDRRQYMGQRIKMLLIEQTKLINETKTSWLAVKKLPSC